MKKSLDSILFDILLLLVILFFVVVPLRNTQLRQSVVAVGSVVLYLLVIRSMLQGIPRYFFFGAFAFLIVVYLGFMTGEQTGLVNLVYSLLNFLTLVFFLGSGKCSVLPDTANRRAIMLFSVSSALVLSVASLLPSAYYFENGKNTGSLVLGMTNPNFTGMMIFFVCSLLLIHFRQNRKNKWCIILLLYLFYLLYLTKARSCFVCAIIVTAYSFLPYRFKIPQIAVIGSLLTPILTVPVYLYLYSTKLRYAAFLGKDLFTGRQRTFMEAIEQIENKWHWWFGDVGKFCFMNAHNAPLALTCSCGLLGTAIVFYLFYRNISALNRKAESGEQRMAVVCILALFIQTSAEALSLMGHFTSTVFILIYVLIASDGKNQNEKERTTA